MAKHVISSENVKKRVEKPTTFIERGSEEPAPEEQAQAEKEVEETEPEQKPVDARVTGLETFASEYGAFSIEVSRHINALNATVADLNAQVTQLRALIFQLNAEVSKLTGDLIRTSTANEEYHAAMAKALRETLEALPELVDNRINETLEIEPSEEEE